VWNFEAKPNCDGERGQRISNCASRIGFSGAPTAIDGVVVSGSNDGMLRVFDTKTGKLMFEFDSVQEYQSVNGISARGGSIDNGTIVARNGLLLVSSGYALFNELPGNVLLAFRRKK